MFIKIVLLMSMLSLGSCGFSPVYGTNSEGASRGASVSAQFNKVDIALIPDREGQFLRNALMDRFYQNGIPQGTDYLLKITPIVENTYDFDITVDSEATRKQLKLTANMVLIDEKTKQKLLTRSLLSIASYNVLQSEFSTIVTEQSARENALNDLARQVEQQLSLYFKK